MFCHIKILDFALAALWRRRYKNGSLLFIYIVFVGLLSSVLFCTDALKREARLVLQSAPELIVQKNVAGRHSLIEESLKNDLAEIPGVAEVYPRYWGYYYDVLTKSNYTVMTANHDGAVSLLQGRLPERTGECAIGNGVRLARGANLGGDLVLINSKNIGTLYQITGLFESESNLLTNDLILLAKEDFLDFFGIPKGLATDLSVRVYNPREIDTIAAKVKEMFPETRPITRREIVRTYESVFNWRSGIFLIVCMAALLSFLIFAWDKATGMSSAEQKEIGILKALGWDITHILELKFWEGFVLSSTAFFVGFVGAYIHVFYLKGVLLVPLLQGWSVLYPEFQLTPYVDIYHVVVVAFLTVFPYVACTLFPSWKAAVLDPETVMRSSS